MNIKTIVLAGLGLMILGGCGATRTTQAPEKSYTVAEVAPHGDKNSCWVIVEGKVYDVTGLIGKHSGGDQAILSNCGKDGTIMFNARPDKGNTPHPESAKVKLDQMLLGVLKT